MNKINMKSGRTMFTRVFTVLLVTAGCTSSETAPTPVQLPPLKAVANQRPPVVAKRVSVPDSAGWLTESIEVKYGPVQASLALKQLIPGGVLRFSFELAQNEPLVSQPPGAITRMDHINAVCAQANWAWHVNQGVVTVTDVETRAFTIHAPPGQSINNLNTNSLNGTTNEADLQSQLTYFSNAYTELYEAIRTVLGLGDDGLSEDQGHISLLGASGQLLATAPPETIQVIGRLVDDYNERINRRVAIEFVLYEVDVTETATRNLDIAAIRKAAIQAGLSFTGSDFNTGGEAGELSLRFREGSGSLGGSRVILNWLNTQGKTSMRLRKKVVALHNQVTSLRDVEVTRYVGRVAVERQVSGPNETSSPTVVVDELHTGEAWAILPTIDDDRVYLRLALSRAALLGFDEYSFGAGNVSGRLPQSTEKSVGLPISLYDGETRLITNLSSTLTRSNTAKSPLLAWLPWLGKSKNDLDRRVESVITMTAHIL